MHSRRKIISVAVLSFALLLIFFLGTGVFFTFQAVQALKTGDFSDASHFSNNARVISSLTTAATFNLIDAVNTWDSGLQSIQAGTELYEIATAQVSHLSGSDGNISITEFEPSLTKLALSLENLEKSAQKSWLISRVITQDQLVQLSSITTATRDASKLIGELSRGTHHWVIVFQNSDEIRASGGFMGSYALISFENGTIGEIVIEDIYDADGQFTGYLPAPPGVEKYLSGGQGLRLPDANWHPDFPTAAQEILRLFALSGRAELDGIVMVSLPLAEDLVDVLGPIEVPDFESPVTGETLSELLRTGREDFFPGSTQKKDQLSALVTQLRIRAQTMNAAQVDTLINLTNYHRQSKNILMYATEPTIQDAVKKYQLDGALTAPPDSDLLALIESNVGINKANQAIDRSVQIESDGNVLTVRTTWIHDGTHSATTDKNSAYVNYQRMIANPDWHMFASTINGEDVKPEHFTTITSSEGESFQEAGFLVVVPEFETVTATISYHVRPGIPLYILKQPGLEPHAVSFLQKNSSLETPSSILLDRNHLIQFKTP